MELFQKLTNFLQEAQELQKPPVIVILGPTASGKTALSLKIARAVDGEIISADSRQIYKHMDIGTDKIPSQKQEGIPHHLLDIVDPDQEFTLADFKRTALKAIHDIHLRKKIPILCGGTGLYLNAVIYNYQIPSIAPNYDLRQKLAQYYEEHGALALHQLLQERDPEAAAAIHHNNVRYVIRALEINMVGNQRKVDQKGESLLHVFPIGIEWPRPLLYERINGRVDDQIARGLLNEVKTLLMKGYSEKLPSMSSLGYLELVSHIKGEKMLEEAIEEIKKNTRNYAKRQITWFRQYKDVYWVPGEELDTYLTGINNEKIIPREQQIK